MMRRNFVAKHAQRSGAGKHKERKRMEKYYGSDHWNDYDDPPSWDDIRALEAQLYPLQEYEKQVMEDEAFVLSKIIEAQNAIITGKLEDCYDILTDAIRMHSEEVKSMAFKMVRNTP